MKLLPLLSLLAFVICFSGCGGGSNYSSPKATMETMMQAAKAEDEDAVMACYSNETRKDFEEMKKLSEEMGHQGDDDDFSDKFQPKSDPIFGEEKISGNTAKMTVTIDGFAHEYSFVKEGGDWKLSMPEIKMGLEMMKGMGGEMQNMMENMSQEMGEGAQESMEELQKKMEDAMKKAMEENK